MDERVLSYLHFEAKLQSHWALVQVKRRGDRSRVSSIRVARIFAFALVRLPTPAEVQATSVEEIRIPPYRVALAEVYKTEEV